jgi:hypothetical protein
MSIRSGPAPSLRERSMRKGSGWSLPGLGLGGGGSRGSHLLWSIGTGWWINTEDPSGAVPLDLSLWERTTPEQYVPRIQVLRTVACAVLRAPCPELWYELRS